MNCQRSGSHPFVGEGFDRQRALHFWDDIASWYSGTQQGSMVNEIVGHLHRTGVLDCDATVLELGCGPGTYTLPMAPLVRSVVGLDTSQVMLDRLSSSVRDMGYSNVTLVKADVMEYEPERRSSAVVSSLCPGTGSVEGLKRMEAWTDHHCAHIMWIVNGWDDLPPRSGGDGQELLLRRKGVRPGGEETQIDRQEAGGHRVQHPGGAFHSVGNGCLGDCPGLQALWEGHGGRTGRTKGAGTDGRGWGVQVQVPEQDETTGMGRVAQSLAWAIPRASCTWSEGS